MSAETLIDSSDFVALAGSAYSTSVGATENLMLAATGIPDAVEIRGAAREPEIAGLGDLLEAEGYRQVFLLGSDATFGGRRQFFLDHGNFEIRDLLYAQCNFH